MEEKILRCALSGALLYKPKVLNDLFDKYGDARKIYGLSGENLMKEMNFKEELIKQIFSKDIIEWARNEVDWTDEKGIQLLFRGDEKYPKLLMECDDAPQMLYYKGVADLNRRAIGVVGTRLASSYGKECCSRIMDDLSCWNPLVISGLAFGIDICAHKEALEKGLETVAVLPNGLDSIYPQEHRDIAVKIVKNGGLLTEFPRTMQAQKINFIKRNRIIAGLSQAIIIVESRVKGGAMTTVEFANMYNREVFALPGRVTDTNSYGCNYLISKNVANIYNAPNILPSALGWDNAKSSQVEHQQKLFSFDNEKKEKLLLSLNFKTAVSVERLCDLTELDFSLVSMLLLELELEGYVKAVNGNGYCLKK